MSIEAALARIDRATSTLSDAYWSDAATASRMVEAINEIDRAAADLRVLNASNDATGQATAIRRGTGLKEGEPATSAPTKADELRDWLKWAGARFAGVPSPFIVDQIVAAASAAPHHHDPDVCDECLGIVEESWRD